MNILDLIKRARQSISELWGRSEPSDRKRFFFVSGAALVVIVAAVLILTRTVWEPLYTGIDTQSAAQFTSVLDERGYPYKLEIAASGATTILVPAKVRDNIALDLAGSSEFTSILTYDIYALGGDITTSERDKTTYERYQLQEHIKRQILQIESIRDALVLLAIPENSRRIFASEIEDPTASVTITTRDGTTPNYELVQTVENLVVGAVVGMKPENVMITDSMGAILQIREDVYTQMQDNYEIKRQVENDLTSIITGFLRPLFGDDRIKVAVNATLNFDDVAQQSTTFSPVVDEDGIPISVNTIEEYAKGFPGVAGVPGIDSSGGEDFEDADIYTEVDTSLASEYQKTSQTINYEVNKVEEQVIRARGQIEQLTISVAVDNFELSEEAAAVDAVQSLIGGAAGLDKTEWGNIQVVYAPFEGVRLEAERYAAWLAQQNREKWIERGMTLALYLIIAICVLLIFFRAMSLFKKREPEEAVAAGDLDEELEDYGELLKLATTGSQIELQKSPTFERIEEFIDNNPEAVASLLRNWLSDDPKNW